ncbi:5'-deoxynucleotidase HDDC2-like [Branchiostoma lanceolatum]|uniref:5'-deoxynucleotidase HDDC2-like n=1 Tax=Branchiostoma lanceolatum TaxID=7740 RepID=UPI003453D051
MAASRGKLLEFMMLVGQLKRVPRTGWVLRGVQNVESVADHMYRMAIMAFLLDGEGDLNRDKCIKIALVHDMAESIVGDIAPADGISKEEKHRREKEAMLHLSGLVGGEVGQELYSLWEEYEQESTAEAKAVKDLDKFDMVLQAFEYETLQNRHGQLQDFFNSTRGKFHYPSVQSWVEELNRLRDNDDTDNPLTRIVNPSTKRDDPSFTSSDVQDKTSSS